MDRIAAGVDSPIFFCRHEGVRWPGRGYQARLPRDAVRRDPGYVSAGPPRLRFLHLVEHVAADCFAYRIHLRLGGDKFSTGESLFLLL